jgi:formylglycine-generating enzyme required for sulfatase activity
MFYIKRGDSIRGPYPYSKIRDGLLGGKLLGTDLYSATDKGPWQPCAGLSLSEDDASLKKSTQADEGIADTVRHVGEVTCRRPQSPTSSVPLRRHSRKNLLLGGGGILLLLLCSGLILRLESPAQLIKGVLQYTTTQTFTPLPAARPFDVGVVNVEESQIVDSEKLDTNFVRALDRGYFKNWQQVREADKFQKEIRLSHRTEVRCFEPALTFDPASHSPSDEASFSELIDIITDVNNTLNSLAIKVAVRTTGSPDLRKLVALPDDEALQQAFAHIASDLERYAIAYEDFSTADRAEFNKYSDPAAERVREGVAAALAPHLGMARFKQELRRVVDAMAAMTSRRGPDAPPPLVPPAPNKECKLPLLRNSIGMEFRLVPAGTFMMGSSNGNEDERPLHKVTISRPFYMGVRRVTYKQYREVQGEGSGGDESQGLFVVDDAVRFCRQLSELSEEKAAKRKYRLPTEAEWEYACRAGTSTRYAFGDDPRLLVLYGADWPPGLARFPAKRCNAWGMYQMHGESVFGPEWVADWYGPYPSEAVVDPCGPAVGTARVVRGPYESANRGFVADLRSGLYDYEAKSRDPLNRPSAGAIFFRVVCDVPSGD